MRSHRTLRYGFPLLAILVVCLALPAAASVDDAGDNGKDSVARLRVGYRLSATEDNARRAGEYTHHEDSVVGGLAFSRFREQTHFYLDADYLTDADYRAEAHFDYRGLLRVNLAGESLYHNLDHIPYPEQTILNPVSGDTGATLFDRDPAAEYGIDVRRSSVHMRGKLPDFPAHVNLSYWRLEREGSSQQRYVDESCTGCHLQSRSREVDRVTEEFTGSVDAHLGPVDVIVEQLVRVFREDNSVVTDTFEPHRYRTTGTALLKHDEIPDSRLLATTVKAHTSLSGGLTAAAGVTLGQRKNRSDLEVPGPVEAETDFTKLVGDVTYIPAPQWTFNLRYRLLDTDASNTDVQVLADILAQGPDERALESVSVRDSLDLTTARYGVTGTWRPGRDFSLKGEYRRQDIERSNTGPALASRFWNLPETESRSSYRLAAYFHPRELRALRGNTWYRYRTTDDPAYGTIASSAHEGFAGIQWASAPWGLTLNGRLAHSENDEHRIVQAVDEEAGLDRTYRLDRRSDEARTTVGCWLQAAPGVTLGLNYGYDYRRVVQDLLFGMDSATPVTIEDEDVEYTQRVHTATASAAWHLSETLSANLEARCSWSRARFNPGFSTVLDLDPEDPTDAVGVDLFPVDSSQLRELSELDIRQAGIQVALDWRPTEAWSATARYRFEDYADRESDLFDGSAQTVTVSVARNW